MTVRSILNEKEFNPIEAKKFSSKIFYLAVFSAFLLGVILTLAYRPNFEGVVYEITENDLLLAQTKCLEKNGLNNLLINYSRSKYQLSALCKDGSSFSW